MTKKPRNPPLHRIEIVAFPAVVTDEAVAELQLAPGKQAVALIKASYFILGVAG